MAAYLRSTHFLGHIHKYYTRCFIIALVTEITQTIAYVPIRTWNLGSTYLITFVIIECFDVRLDLSSSRVVPYVCIRYLTLSENLKMEPFVKRDKWYI